jgi:ABC-type microcin C transport system permease subunit YejB
MAEEKEIMFYSDDRGVRITNARAIAGTTTYAMANITSVALGKLSAKRNGAVWLICIGTMTIVVGLAAQAWLIDLLGIALLGLGSWLAIIAKPRYCVRMGCSSGEVQPLVSTGQKYIQYIVNAMNEAFVKRG